jgi:hypothetical protein
MITLTNRQARRFLLYHQGLWPPYQLQGKSGILAYIKRVGCIQFDPLNIVGRNPELVLQSRIEDFTPSLLEGLLYEDRQLLEGWDKMMSIYGVADWPYFNRRRMAARERFTEHPINGILPQVRTTLMRQGPISSLDLDIHEVVDWSWAPTRLARAALESMYWWGELIIHHRINTRKVYDFSHNHLRDELLKREDPNLMEEAYQDWYVLRRIGSVGLLWGKSGDAWLGMPGIKSKERNRALSRLVEDGRLHQVQVTGISQPFYMRSDERSALETLLCSGAPPLRAAFLAPLDNLIWDRRLVEALFGFSYRWEVYKPKEEREYGYYVLPVLYGDRFVARFEPGRDKKSGDFIIKNWWWEPGVRVSSRMRSAIISCFKRFGRYLGADHIRVDGDRVDYYNLKFLEN